jgi:hypothetical protein
LYPLCPSFLPPPSRPFVSSIPPSVLNVVMIVSWKPSCVGFGVSEIRVWHFTQLACCWRGGATGCVKRLAPKTVTLFWNHTR